MHHWDLIEERSNSESDVLSYYRSEIVISYSLYFSDISSEDDELGRKSKGYNRIYNQYKKSFSPAGRSHFWLYSIRFRLNPWMIYQLLSLYLVTAENSNFLFKEHQNLLTHCTVHVSIMPQSVIYLKMLCNILSVFFWRIICNYNL